MKQAFNLYEKSFDSGQGIHRLVVDETGAIIRESQDPRPGGNHSYSPQTTANVGRNIKELRGQGFRKIRMSDNQYNDFLVNL